MPKKPSKSEIAQRVLGEYIRVVDGVREFDVDALCEDHPELAVEIGRLAERPGSEDSASNSTEHRGGAESTASSVVLGRLRAHAPRQSRYKLLGEFARGGMGAIIKVWDEDLRRNLAMKVVLGKDGGAATGETPPVDPRLLDRFIDEAQVTAQLDHPGIVPVHELGLDRDGQVFFTMRLVKGTDLGAVLEKIWKGEDGWTPTRAVGVILKVCEAMSYAHSKNVVHRDLKPANIMVGRFGEVYVMDWGLARVLGEEDKGDVRPVVRETPPASFVRTDLRDAAGTSASPLLTMDGEVLGTPAYMSPEQSRGDLAAMGPASDVYSIGAILYHVLAGKMPYASQVTTLDAVAIWGLVRAGPPERLDRVATSAPAELVAICSKAMAREPTERYADTAGLGEDLRAYVEGRVVAAYETGAVAELKKWVLRNRVMAAAVAIAMLVILGGTFAFAYARESSQAAKALKTFFRATEFIEEDPARALSLSITGAGPVPTRGIRDRLYDVLPRHHERQVIGPYLGADGKAQYLLQMAMTPDGSRVLARIGVADPPPLAADTVLLDTSTGEAVQIEGPRQQGGITTVRITKDGKQALSAALDGSLKLLDPYTGKHRAGLEHRHGVTAAEFSPDGLLVITGTQDGAVRFWNASDASSLPVSNQHEKSIVSLAISPDGRRLISIDADQNGWIWDIASRTVTARLPLKKIGDDPYVSWDFQPTNAVFTPDGNTVIVNVTYEQLAIWNADTGALVKSFPGGRNTVTLSPDGSKLFVREAKGWSHVWDLQRQKILVELKPYNPILSRFSPDGRSLLIVDYRDKRVQVWDVQSGRLRSTFSGHRYVISDARFVDSGGRILTTSWDGTVRTWDPDPLGEIRGAVALSQGDSRMVLAVSPDGDRCVVRRTQESKNRLMLVDPRAGREIGGLGNGGSGPPEFSLDGTRVAVSEFEQKKVVVFATDSAQLQSRFGDATYRYASFDRSGTQIAATDDGPDEISVFDVATGERKLPRLKMCPAGKDQKETWVVKTAFSSDGRRLLAAGGISRSAVLWDLATGNRVAELQGHTAYVIDVAFSPDGEYMITTGVDETARIWDAKTFAMVQVLRGMPKDSFYVEWPKDNLIALRITGSIHMYRPDGEKVGLLKPENGVTIARMSGDGQHVIAASKHGVIRFWPVDPLPVALRRLSRLLGESGSGR